MITVGVTRIIIELEDGSFDHICISKEFVDRYVDERVFKTLIEKLGHQEKYHMKKE